MSNSRNSRFDFEAVGNGKVAAVNGRAPFGGNGQAALPEASKPTESKAATEKQEAKTAAAEPRDAKGRFAKGNRGGPGNPFARQVAEVRKAFLECGTPEEIREVAKALIAKAKEGDVPAARVVLEYTIGKPEATVKPDRLDQEEFDYFQSTKNLHAITENMLHTLEPHVVLTMLRATREGTTKEFCDYMVPRLRGEVPGYEMPDKKGTKPSTNGGNEGKEPSTNGGDGEVKRGGMPSANGEMKGAGG